MNRTFCQVYNIVQYISITLNNSYSHNYLYLELHSILITYIVVDVISWSPVVTSLHSEMMSC